MPPRLSPRSLHSIQPSNSLGFLHPPSPMLHALPHRPVFSKTPVRPASQQGTRWTQYRRTQYRRTQYNRFGNAQTNQNVRYGVGAVGVALGGFYYYNREQVPITGRRRFNCISPAWEEELAKLEYRMIMQAYGREILQPSHPDSRMVTKVLQRLIPAAGLEGQKWEVRVIDDPDEQNAFVLPGGKVFVFSGILPICAGEDGVAAVLGHEIAHNVAHHTAEKVSKRWPINLSALLLTFQFDIPGQLAQSIVDLVLEKPNSRTMESEADYIGLLMMAQACYDPNAAVGLWERMAEAERHAPPQFLSTHPSNENRKAVIQQWLPQAQQKRDESKCGSTIGYVQEFRRAFALEDDFTRAPKHVDEWVW
ncbi:hypothetical protein IMSHALPRED_003508 [Imshaugia aleurites]|uniref:Peptidase M48 domain-containing protein n=1 Tax=Imshaugia aleurites TaxID=172621 RepID=A0A8H3F720_9LECA|nr:hypothetical protein IMSHALPRED_003508 [Imshaugia aleurites]